MDPDADTRDGANIAAHFITNRKHKTYGELRQNVKTSPNTLKSHLKLGGQIQRPINTKRSRKNDDKPNSKHSKAATKSHFGT